MAHLWSFLCHILILKFLPNYPNFMPVLVNIVGIEKRSKIL